MKEKTKLTLLLFLNCLILIPGFIYGASSMRTNQMQVATTQDAQLIKITVSPKDVTLPIGADETMLREKIQVKAIFKDVQEEKVISDYTTNFKSSNKREVKKVNIMYTLNGCSKKTYVCVKFEETSSNLSPKPPEVSEQQEAINFPYINGYPDRTFRPNQPVTREELATMLARLITRNDIPAEKNNYKDLSEQRFSTNAINYIVSKDIMQPVAKEQFNPSGIVTDNEFREIIKRAKPYILNDSVSLLEGNNPLTRSEAVVALNQLFKVKCSEVKNTLPFKDVKETDPDYKAILCATQPRVEPR